MFYLEKLRQRALLLISEYSSFSFYFCFSLTFSKLQTCALTWCCPGHTITILQISKLLTKRIWSIFWFITLFSLLYALTHWRPNPKWYPEISGMSWGAKISDFGPLWGVFRDQVWHGLEVLDPRIRIPGSRHGMPLDFYIENNQTFASYDNLFENPNWQTWFYIKYHEIFEIFVKIFTQNLINSN